MSGVTTSDLVLKVYRTATICERTSADINTSNRYHSIELKERVQLEYPNWQGINNT